MKDTMTRKNRIRTRIIATALAAISVFSAGSVAMSSVSAATVSSVKVESAASDGFFSGASALIGLIGKSNPLVGIISSGLLGAFKTIYHDATSTPQLSTQDIVNLINELSEKIDSHYNAQTSQVKALDALNKLQNFANILTNVKGYNERALRQIKLYKEGKIRTQDYKNIINCTVGNTGFTDDFMNLSNLITGGQPGIKGKPSFMQYLDYSKSCKENNNDAAIVKKDCEMFNKMTLEQYALYFTNLITGCLAEYNLAEENYKNGKIDLDTKNSLQDSITADMELYLDKAKEVVKKYNEVSDTVKNLKLTVDNCKFAYNKAEKGGAIFADYITTITNSHFEGNNATNNGGAVIADYRGSDWCFSLDIEGSTFVKNHAGNDGGAVYCDSMNYLSLKDVEITNNTAGSNGGGLYCKKGTGSSCDPFISGRITIVGNRLTNGTVSNAFLDENTTSKCIFKICDNIDPNSRIGVTSPTTDKSLDICRIWNKSAYENAADVFSYDNSNYTINRYTHWYSDYWFVEIVRN